MSSNLNPQPSVVLHAAVSPTEPALSSQTADQSEQSSLHQNLKNISLPKESLEAESRRREFFLRGFSLYLVAGNVTGIILTGLLVWLTGNASIWILSGVSFFGTGCCSLAYFCSRIGRVTLGSWMSIIYSFSCVSLVLFLMGLNTNLGIGYAVIIMLSLTLLPTWATIGWTLLCVFMLLTIHLATIQGWQSVIQLEATALIIYQLVISLILVLIISGMALYMMVQFKRASRIAFEQTARLAEALESIESKRQVGEQISQRVLSVTTELNVTTSQQASGSAQQVQSIKEIVTTLRELAQAAQQIAANSLGVNTASDEMLNSVKQVLLTAQTASQAGQASLQIIRQSVESSSAVKQLYQQLLDELSDVSQQSAQMQLVLKTIRELSNETHLLALNAAIESAGAGEYGERFAVVAGEVKGLSVRSMSASHAVNSILGQAAEKINRVVEMVQTGQTVVQQSQQVIQASGQAINELRTAIQQATDEVNLIQQTVTGVRVQTEEISQATLHQQLASQQTVEALNGVSLIATQNSSGSTQVSLTVRDLEELSQELSRALAA